MHVGSSTGYNFKERSRRAAEGLPKIHFGAHERDVQRADISRQARRSLEAAAEARHGHLDSLLLQYSRAGSLPSAPDRCAFASDPRHSSTAHALAFKDAVPQTCCPSCRLGPAQRKLRFMPKRMMHSLQNAGANCYCANASSGWFCS